MFSGNSRVFLLAFAGVFVLILFVGVLSGVSLKAGLGRAFLAGLLFSALLWITCRIITGYVVPQPDAGGDMPPQKDAVGRQLDLTVSDSPGDFSPITPKQIDPDIERIINNDPERMAEIVKKMGYSD